MSRPSGAGAYVQSEGTGARSRLRRIDARDPHEAPQPGRQFLAGDLHGAAPAPSPPSGMASSLLNDVLMQIRKQKTGAYQSPEYFTVD